LSDDCDSQPVKLLRARPCAHGMSDALVPGKEDSDRFDRTRRIGWIDLDSVHSMRCLVIGAGALGNEVVKNLVLSGFRDLALVDMDHIVLSNLNRCLFFREENSQSKEMKALVVAERAMELDPVVKIESRTCRIEELTEDGWGEFDIVLGCLDNIAARLHANSHSYQMGIPYIDGGTNGMAGKVQVVLPPRTPCFQCGLNRSHYRVLEKRFSCTGREVSYFEPKMPAEITTTSVIAAIQVREALKIASGLEDRCIRHAFFYNGMTGMSEEFEMSFDPDCPLHQL
jgi:molybdopterin/thiamine biosynthesis adenylyltransferase